MKYPKLATLTLTLAISPAILNAAELSEIDTSAMPNTFSNGAAADADEVNANFEYIRENLDVLVALLKEQKTLRSDAERFTGTYTVTGIELNTDCSDASLAITHKAMGGTATSTGSQLDLSLSLLGSDPYIQQGENGIKVVARSAGGSDSFSLNLDANGGFTGVLAGSMSTDGNSFTLVGGDNGCPGNVTYLHGVRN